MNFFDKVVKTTATVVYMVLCLNTFGQKPKSQTWDFLNSSGETVSEKKAEFLVRTSKMNDTCWRFEHYNLKGPMLTSIEYKEKAGRTRHGRAVFMRADGTLDSMGNFANGIQHGRWSYFNPDGKQVTTNEYFMGVLTSSSNAEQKKDESRPDKDAEFPEGAVGWQRHLIRNLRYPIYAQQNGLQGTVVTYFQVDQKGLLHDIIVIKSASVLLDDQAIQMMEISPKWIPATKNGEVVAAYKQQPIQFRLER